jgi:hypothetical protein
MTRTTDPPQHTDTSVRQDIRCECQPRVQNTMLPYRRRIILSLVIITSIPFLLLPIQRHRPQLSRSSKSKQTSESAEGNPLDQDWESEIFMAPKPWNTTFPATNLIPDLETWTSSVTSNSQIAAIIIQSPGFRQLLHSDHAPNRFTNHIRLPNILHNISMSHMSSSCANVTRKFWNPTIISLPSWAKNQYLIVSMVLPERASYRESVICEANFCYGNLDGPLPVGEHRCSEDDIIQLGHSGGLRCIEEPQVIQVPATPAEKCEGKYAEFLDIPGFHDPRIFYSGSGEPVLMFSSPYVFRMLQN